MNWNVLENKNKNQDKDNNNKDDNCNEDEKNNNEKYDKNKADDNNMENKSHNKTTKLGGRQMMNGVNLQVLVSRHEEEVVINQLLAHFLIHASEWVVCASQVTLSQNINPYPDGWSKLDSNWFQCLS